MTAHGDDTCIVMRTLTAVVYRNARRGDYTIKTSELMLPSSYLEVGGRLKFLALRHRKFILPTAQILSI